MYYIYAIDASPYLSHHGIKGQKWGVGRFQDAAGSLTEAGRARYGYAKKAARFGVALSKAKAEHYGKQLSRDLNRMANKRANDDRVRDYLNKKDLVQTRIRDLENEHQNMLRQGQYQIDRALVNVGRASYKDSQSRSRKRSNFSNAYNNNAEFIDEALERYGTNSSWTQAYPTHTSFARRFPREYSAGGLLPQSIAYQPFDTLSSASGYKSTIDAGREYARARSNYERELNTPLHERYSRRYG